MFRSTMLIACLLVGVGAQAKSTNLSTALTKVAQQFVVKHVSPMGFKVGDTNNYTLTVASFTGTMVMKVTGVTADDLTIEQIIDVAGQHQDAITDVNPKTGDVISITVNGQKQDPPAPGDETVTSEQAATITVPAGTFNCQDMVIHSKSDNSDTEQWVDAGGTVGVGGLLQMKTTQQGYDIMAQLMDFTAQ